VTAKGEQKAAALLSYSFFFNSTTDTNFNMRSINNCTHIGTYNNFHSPVLYNTGALLQIPVLYMEDKSCRYSVLMQSFVCLCIIYSSRLFFCSLYKACCFSSLHNHPYSCVNTIIRRYSWTNFSYSAQTRNPDSIV
jgi:hypothetical protein